MSVLSIEARVLLLATRTGDSSNTGDTSRTGATSSTGGDAELMRWLAEPLDWTPLARLAEQEKLLSVLWRTLSRLGSAMPPQLATLLRQRAAVEEFRLSLTESVLTDALAVLEREQVPVMLLKGAALAATVYGSFAERPMGDLDILVPAEQATNAWNALRAAGWSLELSGGEEFHRTHHHLPGLLDPRGLQLVLEVHRGFLPAKGAFVLDTGRLWTEAQHVRCGPHDLLVPSPAHHLLLLSVHFAWSHAMSQGVARTVRDVATLLRGSPVNWAAFLDLVRTAHAERCAYWTLRLSQRLGAADVPEHVLRAVRPPQPAVVLDALERAFIATGLMRACPSVQLARAVWKVGMAPSVAGQGAARPWHVSEDFREAFRLPAERAIWTRLLRQVASARTWARFARMVVFGERPAQVRK